MPRKRAQPKTDSEDRSTKLPFLELLARCVVGLDESAWRLLVKDLRTCAQRVAPQISQEQQREEFLNWFLGWPRLLNAVTLAYQGVRELAARKPPAADDEQRGYFLNYMTRAAKSALSEYVKEGLPHKVIYAGDVSTSASSPSANKDKDDSSQTSSFIELLPDPSPPAPLPSELHQEECDVRARLATLPLELRVPFLLTYLVDMITEEELEWIAAQRQSSAQEVDRLIEKERARNFEKKYPLSSTFIGALLGVSQDVVSQRVRRARLLLAKSYGRTLS